MSLQGCQTLTLCVGGWFDPPTQASVLDNLGMSLNNQLSYTCYLLNLPVSGAKGNECNCGHNDHCLLLRYTSSVVLHSSCSLRYNKLVIFLVPYVSRPFFYIHLKLLTANLNIALYYILIHIASYHNLKN